MEYRKNDLVNVQITDLGADGEGIGRAEGFLLFIKDALVGDLVEARITKVKKNYAYARLERVLRPSPYRVEPVCACARQCGGCQLQALSYEKQLAYKNQKVKNHLVRIGGFPADFIDRITLAPIGMNHEGESPYHYRNKAQFPIGRDKEGRPVAGFYAGRTHTIIANTDCALGAEENTDILRRVLTFLEENHIPPYDEKDGSGLVRHVLIRKGFATGQLMVCLVINGKELPEAQRLIASLRQVRGMTSICLNFNQENTNVILGKECRTLWGRDEIEDVLGGITFRISPLSFYQVNPVQTERIYSTALSFAGLTGEETVWDLYCGIGTISLFLARRAKRVCGVEVVPQAVRDARANAARNNIRNVSFFTGKAEDVLPEKYAKEGIRADVIVVDPPRKGCEQACLETMVKMQPSRIVYVSCDSATLARDLKYLCENGYRLQRVQAVDAFCQTVHVEIVCLLSKLNVEHHIEVDLNLDEMDLTAAEKKASYEEIKAYVLEKFGLKVSNLYIAQVKRKCGIIERENYNKAKTEGMKVPKCPEEKEKAIIDALMYFQMI